MQTAQGPERLGYPPTFDGNGGRLSRLSLQLQNHDPRQCGLSHVDGQVRGRTESDYPGNSESSG